MFKRHIIAFSVLGIILLSSYVGYVLVNKQDILQMVQEQIEKTSRQKVKIGDIHLSIFPSLQVEVDDLVLYKEEQPFLDIDKILLSLNLDTLMQKKLVVDTIEIDSPLLTIPVAMAKPAPRKEDNASTQAPDLTALKFLEKITVRHGAIAYGKRYRIEKINADITVSPTHIRLEKLTADYGNGQFLTALNGDIYPQKERLELTVAAKSDDVAALARGFDINLTDTNETFRTLAIAASIEADRKKLVLKKAKITFDDIHLDAEGIVKDYNLSKMAFRTTIDAIDLNRYLPKKETTATRGKENNTTLAETNSTTEETNSSLIQTIDRLTDFSERFRIANSVKIGKITYEKYELEDIFFKSRIADGIIDIDPVTLRMYGGRFDGRLHADLRGGYPLIKGQYKIRNADIVEVFRQKGVPPMLEGNVDLVGRVKTFGLTDEALLKNINIDIAVYGERLLFKKYDLDAILAGLDKMLNFDLVDFAGIVAGPLGMTLVNSYDALAVDEALKRGGQTRIVKMLAAWKIRDGIATARDVAIKTPKNRIALKGEIDLKNKQVKWLTIAILDKKGCAEFLQKLHGTAAGSIDLDNKTGIIAAPFSKLFENRESCTVFYDGKIK